MHPVFSSARNLLKNINKALTFPSRGFVISQKFCIFVVNNKLNVCKVTL